MAGYKMNRFKDLLKAAGIVLLISVVSILMYDIYINIEVDNYQKDNKDITATRTSGEINLSENEETSIVDIIENVSDATVGISKLKDKGTSIFADNSTKQLGLGTGVIVLEDGYILSNEHVSGAKYSSCYVTTSDGKEYTGTVIWSDENVDLSIIKINATNLPYVSLGNSEQIKIGQNVYAIGNPIGFEFQRTVTNGIISAKNRAVKIEDNVYMSDLIQTDATINPGNSGGPLITNTGEVIGINSVKINSAEGIGFAIPINVVKPVIEKIKQNGNFEEATIGIFGFDKEVIPYLDSAIEFDNGIYVAQISLDGPSANSGLKVGDVIISIDEYVVDKMNEIREYIYEKNPGDTVSLRVLRNKKEIDISVVLGRKS